MEPVQHQTRSKNVGDKALHHLSLVAMRPSDTDLAVNKSVTCLEG